MIQIDNFISRKTLAGIKVKLYEAINRSVTGVILKNVAKKKRRRFADAR